MQAATRQTPRPPEVIPDKPAAVPEDGGRARAQDHDDPDQRGRKKKAIPAEKPGAGRTTPMGRKVETPASIKTAGPSGQRGRTQHQKKHTNK